MYGMGKLIIWGEEIIWLNALKSSFTVLYLLLYKWIVYILHLNLTDKLVSKHADNGEINIQN